jgi:hypothetical protein
MTGAAVSLHHRVIKKCSSCNTVTWKGEGQKVLKLQPSHGQGKGKQTVVRKATFVN